MDTLGNFLMNDHARCDGLLKDAIGAVMDDDWSLALWQSAAFAGALEHHLLLEERVLFPAFERRFPYAVLPTVGLRSEHLRIRGIVQRLRNAVTEHDRPAFFNHADALLLLMHQHSEKEEGVLYPMIERALGRTAQELVSAMQRFGSDDEEELEASGMSAA